MPILGTLSSTAGTYFNAYKLNSYINFSRSKFNNIAYFWYSEFNSTADLMHQPRPWSPQIG
jgi:hypothetical protein